MWICLYFFYISHKYLIKIIKYPSLFWFFSHPDNNYTHQVIIFFRFVRLSQNIFFSYAIFCHCISQSYRDIFQTDPDWITLLQICIICLSSYHSKLTAQIPCDIIKSSFYNGIGWILRRITFLSFKINMKIHQHIFLWKLRIANPELRIKPNQLIRASGKFCIFAPYPIFIRLRNRCVTDNLIRCNRCKVQTIQDLFLRTPFKFRNHHLHNRHNDLFALKEFLHALVILCANIYRWCNVVFCLYFHFYFGWFST